MKSQCTTAHRQLSRNVRVSTKLAMRQLESGEKLTMTQADRIVLKFNGVRNLARAIDVDMTTVYKWTYPRNKQGTNGLVPSHAMLKILAAARREGVLLTADDLSPEPQVYDVMYKTWRPVK